MSIKTFRLNIITPKGLKVDEEVDLVVLRSIYGDMGIMANHAFFSVALNYSILRFINNGIEQRIAVYGGIATVKDNMLKVLTSGAEWPQEIDLAKAQSDRDHAERRLREKSDDLTIRNDQVLLRRALVQIEISARSLADEEE